MTAETRVTPSPSENGVANKGRTIRVDWLAIWILFSAWSSLSGWCLSILRCLNPTGIVLSYLLFFSGLILFRAQLQVRQGQGGWRILRSRFLTPKLWLFLTVLALIGGLAYAPANYDYLTYRFTRVLYWSWDQGWSWIPTVNKRINYSGVGIEWLMTPLFILFKTDRLFFLINFLSYLLMPGVVFSVFTRLGISQRISWWWMWVLPCGYCYILQAASAGNDSFAAVYFLASIHYLFQTKNSAPTKNLFLSCLAIALMTEVKASNLPLVLPWLVVLFLQRHRLLEKSRVVFIGLMLLLAAPVSFLPTAALNIYFTGDYTGDPTNSTKMKVSNPVSGLLGNALEMAKDNLALPVTLHSTDWSPKLPSFLKTQLQRDFPKLDLKSGELQMEEGAGAGLGMVLFAALFLGARIGARRAEPDLIAARKREALWVVGAGGIALLAYMAKIGSEASSRLLATYYPLIIAGVLVMISLDGRIMHRRFLRWGAYVAMLSALPLVILCPARPLFPVHAVSDLMVQGRVSSEFIARYNQVYSVYAARSDAFKEMVAFIPTGERALGFIQISDDTEVSLWRPFGSRKVIEVGPHDSPAQMRAEGIHFVLVGQEALGADGMTIGDLMAQWSASVVEQRDIILKAHQGPETWYLLKL